MAGRLPRRGFFSATCIVTVILIFLLGSPVFSKYAHYSLSDSEIRDRKYGCYADIDSGLWGQKCRSSMIERENCALRCISPVCYELIYENDPLEEGEKDFVRSHDFKYCMHQHELNILDLLVTEPMVSPKSFHALLFPYGSQRGYLFSLSVYSSYNSSVNTSPLDSVIPPSSPSNVSKFWTYAYIPENETMI